MTKRLDLLLAQLSALREEIAAGEPVFPAWALEKVTKGICLGCGKSIPKTEKSQRGNDLTCYRQVMRAIERGDLTDHNAVEKGLLSPKGKAKQRVNPPKNRALNSLLSKSGPIAEKLAEGAAIAKRNKKRKPENET